MIFDDERPISGEKRLWLNVLRQAFDDAFKPHDCKADDRPEMVKQARAWLTEPNRDFDIICALCELDADVIRSAANEMISAQDKGQISLTPRQNLQSEKSSCLPL